MGIYNVNKVLKYKRKALGITHEELSTNLSVQTISRIENLKTTVSSSVHKYLMGKMGQLTDEPCTPIEVSNLEQLELMYEITSYTNRKECDLARDKIKLLLSKINMITPRNKQYVEFKTLELDFMEEKISDENFFDKLRYILKYTIPQLDDIDIANWPLSVLEVDILTSLFLFFRSKERYNEAYELILKIKKSLDMEYMIGDEFYLYYITVLYYLADVTGSMGYHKKAIEYSKQGIEYSIKSNIIGMLHCLYYDVAWNTEKLIEKNILPTSEKTVCIDYLRKSYYLSLSIGRNSYCEFIKKHMDSLY